MTKITRRTAIKGAAAIAGVAGLSTGARAATYEPMFKIEKNARLRVLRWKRFVQGDEDMWMKNSAKFAELTGVQVRVDNEAWEDVRPKAAVAANVGSGPDIILGWLDDPHLYPGQAGRRDRRRQSPGRQGRRLVRRRAQIRHARQPLGGAAARRLGRAAQLPHFLGQGSRVRQVSDQLRRLPEALARR